MKESLRSSIYQSTNRFKIFVFRFYFIVKRVCVCVYLFLQKNYFFIIYYHVPTPMQNTDNFFLILMKYLLIWLHFLN